MGAETSRSLAATVSPGNRDIEARSRCALSVVGARARGGGERMAASTLSILVAQLAMVVLPTWVCIKFFETRLPPLTARLSGGVIGVALGAYCVYSTFYEPLAHQTPELTIEVPAGFAHEAVIFIEDQNAPLTMAWSQDGPFATKHARVVAPKSGVIRVSKLEVMHERTVDAQLDDGRVGWGQGSFDLDGASIVYFDFVPFGNRTEPDIGMMERQALRHWVAERELER